MVMSGKAVSGGLAIAPLRRCSRNNFDIDKHDVQDSAAEVKRFESARILAANELGQLAEQLGEKLGEYNSRLFEIHQMMLDDLDYRSSVEEIIISEGVNAEYAVSVTTQKFAKKFSDMDSNEYMRARAADVLDISRRVMAFLSGAKMDLPIGEESVILLSDDFAPSETAQFDRTKVKGLVTLHGSPNSHTSIFARSMGIPAIISLQGRLSDISEHTIAVLDGDSGELVLDPSNELLEEYQKRQKETGEERRALNDLQGVPAITKSGRKIQLYANISTADAKPALENDAEGIGLFRSEFLYLENSDFPDEEIQLEAYKNVLETMGDRRVVIRTLDIGADKQLDYFHLPKEANPALGMRAIRLCLSRPEIFTTQLRALYRASVYGNLAIVLPMVNSLKDVLRAKDFVRQVKHSLTAEGIAFAQDVPLGIMIETPAAAILSDLLVDEVDFFTIGTNDLTQYTLAVDRTNDSVSEFCDEHHEAIMRLIAQVAANAHSKGKWVGICGELAADESLTERFLDMKIGVLSVAPPKILPLRKKIIQLR